MNDNILTEEEIRGFKSMSVYWREVRTRGDQSPLSHDAHMVIDRLGVRVLDLVEAYIENIEIERDLDKVRCCTEERYPHFGQPLVNGECRGG